MKNKYILILLLLLSGLTAWKFYMHQNKKINNLRIAYSFFEKIETIDPANVQDIYQANLIENLYSRLIEYNNDGEIECKFCQKYEVKNNIITFEIRENIKSSKGELITAEDIGLSFRRLFHFNTNTHGDLKLFISKPEQINWNDKQLTIELNDKKFVPFLMPVLASMDYSIIPKNALNKNDQIVDYTNTSGPYFLKSSDENKIILKANQHSYEFNEDMPQEITVIRTQNKNATEEFKNDKVDVIDVTMYPRNNLYSELISDKSLSLNQFKTFPLNLLFIGVSNEAQNKFSEKEIFFAARVIKEVYKNFNVFGYGFTETSEFYQQGSNGQLLANEKKEIEDLRNKSTIPPKNIITFGVHSSSFEKVKEAFKNYHFIKVIAFEEDPAFLPENKRPNLYLQTTDSSFLEDFATISYNLKNGNFGLNEAHRNEWLVNYTNTSNKIERIELLRKLQFEFLKKPTLIPLVTSPYWAISKKEYELNFPQFYPGSHWWKIRKL